MKFEEIKQIERLLRRSSALVRQVAERKKRRIVINQKGLRRRGRRRIVIDQKILLSSDLARQLAGLVAELEELRDRITKCMDLGEETERLLVILLRK